MPVAERAPPGPRPVSLIRRYVTVLAPGAQVLGGTLSAPVNPVQVGAQRLQVGDELQRRKPLGGGAGTRQHAVQGP